VTFAIRAESEDFAYPLIFSDLVIYQNRAMQQFAHTRSFPDCPTHARKIDQKVYVVKQRLAKTRSRLIIVFGYVPDDFG